MTEAKEDILEGGSYEILHQRILSLDNTFSTKLNQLNQKRRDIFGATDMSLVAEDRIATENNCVPRDITGVGNLLIFGYNVFIGLKSSMNVEDVISIHSFNGTSFAVSQCDAFSDPQFIRDFKDLYKYYKKACFLQFIRMPAKLLLIFQSGETVRDVMVFRFAIDRDENLSYIDNRGDQDYVTPPQQSFEWTGVSRENQIQGKHPHVNIDDTLFVECIEGDLTIKVENNTDTGSGIYSEPVEDKDQALDDATIQYACVEGLYLLKIRPFGENDWRYFVFNPRFATVKRIDSIAQACILLPEGQGFIFPKGCYQQDGSIRLFDADTEDMKFLECIKSPNGEDYMYIFYNAVQGRHIIFAYNLISKEISAPIICHGYSLYDDGRMVIFTDPDGEARRNHSMQVWQTPFYADSYSKAVKTESFLSLIGNRSLVRGISEGYGISRLIHNDTVTVAVYQQIIRDIRKMLDSYHWLSNEECLKIADDLNAIRTTAISAVGEYEKYLAIKSEHENRLKKHEEDIAEIRTEVATTSKNENIDVYVAQLEKIRACKGASITLKDLKYIDAPRLEECAKLLDELTETVSTNAIDRLLAPDGLDSYIHEINDIEQNIPSLTQRNDCDNLQKELDKISSALDLLTNTVGNLNITDAQKSADIINRITELFANVNRLRAAIRNKALELGAADAKLDFASQFKLLSQSVANHIAIADTEEKCNELLTRTLVTIEELEGKFADYEDFIEQISNKRDEIITAFNARSQQLGESRQKRIQHLGATASRILKGILSRAAGMKDADTLNACFITDAMAVKYNDCIQEIRDLGNSVLADDLDGQIRAARDEALRRQRDKEDIFQESGATALLGGHRFHVNSQPFNITTVVKDDRLFAHITGTDMEEPVADNTLNSYADIWDQSLPSESKDVSRCEYLAYDIFNNASHGSSEFSLKDISNAISENKLNEIVNAEISRRYDEGYERGIHDNDATLLLAAIVKCNAAWGMLKYSRQARACAMLAYALSPDQAMVSSWKLQLASQARHARLFGTTGDFAKERQRMLDFISGFCTVAELDFDNAIQKQAAEFLLNLLLSEQEIAFPAMPETADALNSFNREMHLKNLEGTLKKEFDSLKLADKITLGFSWATAFLKSQNVDDINQAWELASFILTDITPFVNKGVEALHAENLRSNHKNIANGQFTCRFDDFLLKMDKFVNENVPRFRCFRAARNAFIERRSKELHIEEFQAKTMGGFVRNKLINNVYLKLIGDNFAKQMGAAENGRRTDQMGLLLLISPPGYGKTTLMEYVASTLGLAFMRINGPSIGNKILSLDPGAAPNATARLELEKLNLALAMGNNVMLYIDDIQHLNPEFLQKFISLCDAQRKIEGVFNGETKTFNLRGKKFAIVMAGNPYTESGTAFKVPDMLANRADTYNLGDITSSNQDIFALSFLENSITSNTLLSEWNRQWGDTADLENFVTAAKRGTVEDIPFKNSYSPAELDDLVRTVKYMCMIRSTVLQINSLYIASAAQQDEYRSEPPFKLQGSYRNMNKMVEKIYPVMTEDEVKQIIMDHYKNEAQTLTTGAEQNLLKFKEIMGWLDPEEEIRWNEIKTEFIRRLSLSGLDDSNDFGKITAQLSAFSAGMLQIKNAIEKGFAQSTGLTQPKQTTKQEINLEPLAEAIRAKQEINLEPLAEAIRAKQEINLEPLAEAIRAKQEINLEPLAEAIRAKQEINLEPLAEALRKQEEIMQELGNSLKNIHLDTTPIVNALNALQNIQTSSMQLPPPLPQPPPIPKPPPLPKK